MDVRWRLCWFFHIETIPNPLTAFEHLKKAQDAMIKLNEDNPGVNLLDGKIMNGIWLIFSQLHTRKDYQEWFRLFGTIQKEVSITDIESNEFYVMAGASIYRNAILKNIDAGENIPSLLRELIQLAQDSGLGLLAAYALRYLIKYTSEVEHNLEAAQKLTTEFEIVYKNIPVYEFLVLTQLGSNYFVSGNREGADYYLREFVETAIPAIYVERLDYLIAYMQVASAKDPQLSSTLVNRALSIAINTPGILIEDKVKLYGETAIGATRDKKFTEALHLYEDGYELLLNNFTNNPDQQSLVIRYGNAIKYVAEMIEFGFTPSFGGEKWVIPETGYFYRTTEALLADGFYFDERKFVVAYALQDSFELTGELDKAKKWAYKSFELSLDVKDAQFIPVMQTNLFYLVDDNEYRQAYNILSYIDKYYAKIKLKAEQGEGMDEERRKLLISMKNNDLSLYAFVLLPIAFKFALLSLKKTRTRDEFKSAIDDAFQNDQYTLKDPVSFAMAKTLFEKILLEDITYQQMQELLSTYTGEFREILSMIGCLLLSSRVNALEAANLHLATIVALDSSMNNSNSQYKHCLVPFFINFWKEMIESRPGDFSGKDHLKTKGLALVYTKAWSLRIPTLFRVLSNHVNFKVTGATQEFIERE